MKQESISQILVVELVKFALLVLMQAPLAAKNAMGALLAHSLREVHLAAARVPVGASTRGKAQHFVSHAPKGHTHIRREKPSANRARRGRSLQTKGKVSVNSVRSATTAVMMGCGIALHALLELSRMKPVPWSALLVPQGNRGTLRTNGMTVSFAPLGDTTASTALLTAPCARLVHMKQKLAVWHARIVLWASNHTATAQDVLRACPGGSRVRPQAAPAACVKKGPFQVLPSRVGVSCAALGGPLPPQAIQTVRRALRERSYLLLVVCRA